MINSWTEACGRCAKIASVWKSSCASHHACSREHVIMARGEIGLAL